MFRNSLSLIIKRKRTKVGLSQQELADKLFVSRSLVARWENGLSIPSDDNLDLLNGVLNFNFNVYKVTDTKSFGTNMYLFNLAFCFVVFLFILLPIFPHTISVSSLGNEVFSTTRYFSALNMQMECQHWSWILCLLSLLLNISLSTMLFFRSNNSFCQKKYWIALLSMIVICGISFTLTMLNAF